MDHHHSIIKRIVEDKHKNGGIENEKDISISHRSDDCFGVSRM
jgi:hypothetical protein